MTATYIPAEGAITMFSTEWCGYCKRLKMMLDHEGIEYKIVDIEEDQKASDIVGEANGGDHIVPTVLFADGTTATNPSITEVKERIAV